MRRKYDVQNLHRFKYPNLVAEFMETGYSICTISEHMGLGRCSENDPQVNAKLFGEKEILTSEAFGLARLFSCRVEYLFSHELTLVGSYPAAYVRHCESNRRQEKEIEAFRMEREICEKLRKESDLLQAVYKLVNAPESSRHYLVYAILGHDLREVKLNTIPAKI